MVSILLFSSTILSKNLLNKHDTFVQAFLETIYDLEVKTVAYPLSETDKKNGLNSASYKLKFHSCKWATAKSSGYFDLAFSISTRSINVIAPTLTTAISVFVSKPFSHFQLAVNFNAISGYLQEYYLNK